MLKRILNYTKIPENGEVLYKIEEYIPPTIIRQIDNPTYRNIACEFQEKKYPHGGYYILENVEGKNEKEKISNWMVQLCYKYPKLINLCPIKLNIKFIKEIEQELIELEDFLPEDIKTYIDMSKRKKFLYENPVLKESIERIEKYIEESEESINTLDEIFIVWLATHSQFEGMLNCENYKIYQKNKDIINIDYL